MAALSLMLKLRKILLYLPEPQFRMVTNEEICPKLSIHGQKHPEPAEQIAIKMNSKLTSSFGPE